MSPFAQFACDNGLNVRGKHSLEGSELWAGCVGVHPLSAGREGGSSLTFGLLSS